MTALKSFSIFAIFATVLSGQQRVQPDKTAFLPFSQPAEFSLVAPPNAPANAQPLIEQITRADGTTPVAPQPEIVLTPPSAGLVTATFKTAEFWHEAFVKIDFNAGRGAPITATYVFWHGPVISANSQKVDLATPWQAPTILVPRNEPAQVWIYNPDGAIPEAKWRVSSGTEEFCGLNEHQRLRTDCENASKLPEVPLPQGQSAAVRFYIPNYWRNPLHIFGAVESRSAVLQLRVDHASIDSNLNLSVVSNGLDIWDAWLSSTVRDLARAFLLIGLGAALLLFAQVVVPNFRNSMAMEAEIELLREQLRAINSGVGNRLYTRCQQELARVMDGLGIREPIDDGAALKGYRLAGHHISRAGRRVKEWVRRLGINSNTQEILRIENLLPRLETRLDLTQRLSDILTRLLEAGTLAAAPSFTFDREEKLQRVREILSRQLLTKAEADSVSAILNRLAEGSISKEDFAPDLNSRLESIRRQLKTGDFRRRADRYIARINGCKEIIDEPAPASPASQWSIDELIFRDLLAIKLRMILFAIQIEGLLADKPLFASMPDRLQSNDPATLAQIDDELRQISEGVSEDDLRDALRNELWDTLSEPTVVRRQDVPQFSFWFRNRKYNTCAARDRFQCYWKISSDSNPGEVYYEEGWTIQYIPVGSRFSVEPEIYDGSGNALVIKQPDSPKGVDRIRVVEKSDLLRRSVRGLIDAALTALVPVATVALTEMDSSYALSALKLIGLGFTSQAIRSAIIPESVRPEAASKAGSSDPKSPPPGPANPPAGPPPSPGPSAAGPQAVTPPGARQNEAPSGQHPPSAAEGGAATGESAPA